MHVAALLNLVLAAGTVAVAIVAGLSYGSRKALREANADLRDRVTDLEKADALKTAQMAELKSRNDVLTSMVTGEVHWKALGEDLDQLIRDAHKHWEFERSQVHWKSLSEALDLLIRDAHKHWTEERAAFKKVLQLTEATLQKIKESDDK